MAKRIYLAGPLFCVSETERNRELGELLRSEGFEVFLPQEIDSGITDNDLKDSKSKIALSMRIFRKDIGEIDRSDILLMNLDGRVPDEGACVELGYAYSKGKCCIGIKTDIRTAEYGMDNMMITGALDGRIAQSDKELIDMLKSL